MRSVLGLMWVLLACSAAADEMAAQPLPHEIVVTAGSPGELLQALRPWVAARLQAQVGAVQAEPYGGWHWPVRSARSDRWRVTWQPALPRHGDWLVALHAKREEGGHAGVDVRYLARELQLVWRVRSPVQKGEAIGCAALVADTRVKQPSVRIWSGRCDDLVGLVARRPLVAGEVLTESDVGARLAVQRQQPVQVSVRSQGVVIEARGQALADAQIGQRVPVRVMGQNSVLQATVTAPGELQILEGME